MKKDKPGFFYLKKILPELSEAKLNEGVLNASQIRAILKDCNFKSILKQKEKRVWNVFEAVSIGFCGNTKDPEYKQIIEELLILLIAYKAPSQKVLLACVTCLHVLKNGQKHVFGTFDLVSLEN